MPFESEVLVTCTRGVRTIARSKRGAGMLCAAGVAHALVIGMRAFPSNMMMQEHSLAALCNVAMHRPCEMDIRPPRVSRRSRHPSSRRAHRVTPENDPRHPHALSALALDEFFSSARSAGCTHCALHAMRCFPKNAQIAQHALTLMQVRSP